MKKLLTLCALLSVAALPATASAVDPPTRAEFKTASNFCKAYKANAGVNNFVSVFGARKNAFGKCVSRTAKAEAAENDAQLAKAQSDAKRECKKEQADATYFHQQRDGASPSAAGQTFNAYYGKNDNDKNAYGKCRSKLAHDLKAAADAQDKVEAQNKVSAAKTCKQEKADAAVFHANNDGATPSATGTTFASYYGTNENNKNAYGKCVSRTAKELNQQEQAQQS